jgi:hypothetical protein
MNSTSFGKFFKKDVERPKIQENNPIFALACQEDKMLANFVSNQ